MPFGRVLHAIFFGVNAQGRFDACVRHRTVDRLVVLLAAFDVGLFTQIQATIFVPRMT